MARMCTNCHKVFDGSKRYCSERCAREVRRQRLQILLGCVLGALVLAFAIYTAPSSDLRPEPRWPMSAFELQQLAHDESCPICAAKTKVDCKVCIDGKIFYMGTSAACSRCSGNGWIICPACKGSGKFSDAIAAAKT